MRVEDLSFELVDDLFWGAHYESEYFKNISDKEKQKIIFAPEGRGKDPLSAKEVELVEWFLEHEKEVYENTLKQILDEYEEIKDSYKDAYDDEDFTEFFPEISNLSELEKVIKLKSVNIHQISHEGIPFIGVELECPWDDEHGLGVLLYGKKPLEVGEGYDAVLLWLAEEYLEKIKDNTIELS
jgi:hypothetical protein